MTRRFVIVTGMSGAGKSSVLNILEDAGYFCVDNLPFSLLHTFIGIVLNGSDEKYNHTALGVDIRSGGDLSEFAQVLEELKKEEVPIEILYLDSSDEVLIKRYKETRRIHPITGKKGRVEEGIKKEREQLAVIKEMADVVMDTSTMLMRALTRNVIKQFANDLDSSRFSITILSFGFKFGIPAEADLVFDVRFLPNPYYVDSLKALSGNDPPVSDFVLGHDITKTFVDKAVDMIEFLIPGYVSEGKSMLVIAVGCTGGRHRSVAIANELYRRLKNNEEEDLIVEHRDLIGDLRVKGNS